jgi:hypothetical protein
MAERPSFWILNLDTWTCSEIGFQDVESSKIAAYLSGPGHDMGLGPHAGVFKRYSNLLLRLK